jgi:hypothetical protein
MFGATKTRLGKICTISWSLKKLPSQTLEAVLAFGQQHVGVQTVFTFWTTPVIKAYLGFIENSIICLVSRLRTACQCPLWNSHTKSSSTFSFALRIRKANYSIDIINIMVKRCFYYKQCSH